MKNSFKYISICGILLFATSCTDLEENLIGDVTADVSSEGIGGGSGGGANDPIAGAFNKLLSSGTANHGDYWTIQSLTADDMVITVKSGGWYDGGVWLDLYEHTYSSTSSPVKTAWNSQYSAIAECNTALSGDLNDKQEAQVRVLRAFFYYRLLDTFGNVKIVTETNSNPPQANRQQVYDFVESEILTALGILGVSPTMNLSNSDLGTDIDPYRVNIYGALGLLSKLYLNAEVYTGSPKYAEAALSASYVIDNSGFILATQDNYSIPNLGRRPAEPSDPEFLKGYAAVFAPNNSNNPEMIWSVPFDESTGPGMNFSTMFLHYGSQFTWNLEQQPWNGYAALEDFYNSFADEDVRKKANFIEGLQLDYSGSTIVDYGSSDDDILLNYTPHINELTPNAILKAGVRMGKFSFKQFGRLNMDNDYPIIRLGEMYLIRAEGLARSAGNWALALPDVNTIRERANLPPLSSITSDGFLEERGHEMFMEVSRRQDLIRFGKYGDPGWEKEGSEPYKELFPIPDDQIQASGGTLKQNSGY